MKVEITITGTLDSATAQMYRVQADGSREYLGNLTASLEQVLVDLASIYAPPAETPAAS